jgi:exosortase N
MGFDYTSHAIVPVPYLFVKIKKVIVLSISCWYWVKETFAVKRLLFIAITIIYCAVIRIGCSDYFQWASPLTWFGVLTIAYLHSADEQRVRRFSARYLLPVIGFIILTLFLPVKTFLYFSIVLGFLLACETMISLCGHLYIMIFVIISPIFNYFTTVFTFPIRLQLSQAAVSILSYFNSSVKQHGNNIEINSVNFSVDAECMGLNMVCFGMLIGVFLLAYYQKCTKRTVTFFQSALFLSCIFLLIILTNLIRIIILVQFNISQTSFLHELAGDLCFLVYVIIPATKYIQWLVKGKRVINFELITNCVKPSVFNILQNVIVFVTLLFLSVFVLHQKKQSKIIDDSTTSAIPGFESKFVEKDILKLENSNTLVYVKHIKSFYSTEHSPMICWKGSGYVLGRIKEEYVEGKQVYMAELTKEKDILYTCWWFDNGNYQTVDQLKWRWMVLKGADEFSIVNVTSSTKEQLQKSISGIFKNDIVNKALNAQSQISKTK